MKIDNHIVGSLSGVNLERFSKGHILERKGNTSKNTYLVRKGLLRSYFIDPKGKEHIFMFASEDWIIADIESIGFNQPNQLFIDCIEDSEIVVLNSETQYLNLKNEKAVKEKLTQLYVRMGMLQRRIIIQMSTLARDRYQYFLETYPDLPNRVPQHMIASYLGITPQAVSTIRANFSKKHNKAIS